jgi:tetratricopeptide (TPR) repeat protein
MPDQYATDSEISELVAALGDPGVDDVPVLSAMLARYPEDARLHFMLGSVHAGQSRPLEAHAAMTRAVELAPDFRLARYQLGFFELTSGEANRALSTWGPLLAAGADDYLRVFVEGMTYLIRDEFSDAIRKFERGIELNTENPPMNDDIRLLMGQIADLQKKQGASQLADDGQTSATSLLLGQFSGNPTIN